MRLSVRQLLARGGCGEPFQIRVQELVKFDSARFSYILIYFSMKIRILVLFIFYKYFYMLSELSVNILT